jgi:hypothetical protein
MADPGALMRLTTVPTILVLLLAGTGVFAGVTHSVNEENGLRGWRFLEGDIEIELVQRLPDQTRALFMNHEFSREVIEQLALSCMFQTIVRNTDASGSGRTVAVDLTRWRTHHDGVIRELLMKEPLLASWNEQDASEAARLVIRWGMFPTRQEYLPSDYNWGLTAYGIPPGSKFDLDVSWTEDGKPYSGVIRDVVCTPDVDKLK